MTQADAAKALITQSHQDREVADDLFKTGKYMYCLFFHHLALEKILKALILVKNKKMLYVHDLVRLAGIAEITLDNTAIAQLGRISDFNIEARYDDYKSEFYKEATETFTKEWVGICTKYYDTITQYIHDNT